MSRGKIAKSAKPRQGRKNLFRPLRGLPRLHISHGLRRGLGSSAPSGGCHGCTFPTACAMGILSPNPTFSQALGRDNVAHALMRNAT